MLSGILSGNDEPLAGESADEGFWWKQIRGRG